LSGGESVEAEPIPDPIPLWERFRDERLPDYKTARDRPDLDATSRLSPYLRWGLLHPRTLLAELDDSEGAATFRSELAWREFYADVLWHKPDTARQNYDRKFDRMEHDTDDGRFRAWCEGRTGYPIVDAGMRQLLVEGWMHNRVRMIVASFLVKDLHLPWWWGARHFMRHLVDGDLASNQHGWQWVAGSGTDAAPYFRVFNPTTQGERFDPSGDYVRRYVPELRDVPGKQVHQPHDPIVDHAHERQVALARYGAVKT
jgi:deoxyribodipyrimidine photo-lyase